MFDPKDRDYWAIRYLSPDGGQRMLSDQGCLILLAVAASLLFLPSIVGGLLEYCQDYHLFGL